LFVNEDYLFCRVIPGFAQCLLNPSYLRPVPIPEKTEDATAEAEMELDLKECGEVLYDLDAPDEEEERNGN
jgi:hypothetical protein